MSDYLAEMKRIQAVLDRDDAAAKAKGILVGRYIQHSVADSYATYKITAVRGNSATIEVVDIGDGYRVAAWGNKARISVNKAREFLNRRDGLAALFSRTDGWWDKRKVGEIVHYSNGSGQYVRGEIIEHAGEKKMLPIALVGDWPARDLGVRRPDGSVYYSYNAKQIIDREPTKPNASNMVEYPDFRMPPGQLKAVVAVMPVLVLGPPAMSSDEVELSKLVKLRDAVAATLAVQLTNDAAQNVELLRAALAKAKDLLDK